MTETNNNQPATKGDLADLRTELKTDITDLRTALKTDITDLRTELKTDIKNLTTTVNSLGLDVAKNNLQMNTLEHNMLEALRSFKSDLLSAFEASVMKGQMYAQKAITHGDILSGHEEKLLNHETRLASLESK
ncbi:MAG: hypothetical protein Q7R35_05420 [Elusimicrobiota bacterium]|nr:hypothetical protein [Elusimicrobiota bacterium]